MEIQKTRVLGGLSARDERADPEVGVVVCHCHGCRWPRRCRGARTLRALLRRPRRRLLVSALLLVAVLLLVSVLLLVAVLRLPLLGLRAPRLLVTELNLVP